MENVTQLLVKGAREAFANGNPSRGFDLMSEAFDETLHYADKFTPERRAEWIAELSGWVALLTEAGDYERAGALARKLARLAGDTGLALYPLPGYFG